MYREAQIRKLKICLECDVINKDEQSYFQSEPSYILLSRLGTVPITKSVVIRFIIEQEVFLHVKKSDASLSELKIAVMYLAKVLKITTDYRDEYLRGLMSHLLRRYLP